MSAYTIVDIPGWENLSLLAADRPVLDRRLDELATGSVPDYVPRDTATPFRLEMRRHLGRLVEQARSVGAGLLCLPTQKMGDIPIPASYTVSEWRDVERDEVAPEALLDALTSRSEATVSRLVLDGQPALREESVEAADPEEDELATHAGRRVTYTVAAPDDPKAWVVLTFTTLGDGDPTGPLADLLVELFDAQLTTIRWRQPARPMTISEAGASRA